MKNYKIINCTVLLAAFGVALFMADAQGKIKQSKKNRHTDGNSLIGIAGENPSGDHVLLDEGMKTITITLCKAECDAMFEAWKIHYHGRPVRPRLAALVHGRMKSLYGKMGWKKDE